MDTIFKKILISLLIFAIGAFQIASIYSQSSTLPDSYPAEETLLEEEEEKEIDLTEETVEESDPYTENVEPVIVDNQDIRAEFVQYTQDPRTKKVRFEIVLYSNIDSDRVLLTWNVSGVSLPDKDQSMAGILQLTKGGEYRIPITVIPTSSGLSEVFGRVEVTNIDNRSLVTVRKNFATNDKREILPITDEYKSLLTQQTLITIVLTAIGITIGLIVLFFGLRFFIKWLDREEIN